MSQSQKKKDYIEIKKLFGDFLTWVKNPNPERKIARDQEIQRIEAKIRAEEDIQRIEEEAYRLWKADGRPEGKEDDYRRLAIHKIKGENIPTIYKPYYLLEKRVLEPTDVWISKQVFFTILGRLGNLALIAAVIAFIFGEEVRRNNEIFSAWQTITNADGKPGSGGRIKALQFLNSRPPRFPWIGITKKGLYWDKQEKKCQEKRLWGLRWERQPLRGLSAPEAYLADIHLCGADLGGANLEDAFLRFANLQNAKLRNANLQNAKLRGANLQNAKLRDANLQNAELGSANLQDDYLVGANLQNAYLVNANLQNANLGSANLQDAYLGSANLQDAYLVGANLQNAKLEGANLQNANLGSANLQDAYLGSANLQNAELRGANLQNAYLGSTKLQNAYLKGAYLGKAKNLTPKKIKSACFWDKAIYKGKWNKEKEALETKEPNNTNFIEDLKKDTSSDPKEPVDCSRWSRSR